MWEPRRLTTLWAFTACYRDQLPLPHPFNTRLLRCTVLKFIHSNLIQSLSFWTLSIVLFLIKSRTMDNIQNSIIVLIYHRNKLVDLIHSNLFEFEFTEFTCIPLYFFDRKLAENDVMLSKVYCFLCVQLVVQVKTKLINIIRAESGG
jgi:hypothetical protein